PNIFFATQPDSGSGLSTSLIKGACFCNTADFTELYPISPVFFRSPSRKRLGLPSLEKLHQNPLSSHFREILFRFLHQLSEGDLSWARAPGLKDIQCLL